MKKILLVIIHCFSSIIVISVAVWKNDEKIFKEEEATKILKITGLYNNTYDKYISYQMSFSILMNI